MIEITNIAKTLLGENQKSHHVQILFSIFTMRSLFMKEYTSVAPINHFNMIKRKSMRHK